VKPHARALLALASAVLTVLAFPPFGAWPLALAMLAPLAAALWSARPLGAFTLTYAYSLAMALAIVRWLVHALAVEYATPPATAWLVTAGLVAAYALVPAFAMAAFAALRPRLAPALAPLAFAALYAFSEWFRAAPLGLPWLLASHALAPAPGLLQSAEWIGAGGASFVAIAISAGIGFAWAQRSARPLWAPLLLGLAAACAVGIGAARLREGEPLRVGVVQASTPQRERWQAGAALVHAEDYAALTRELLASAGPLDVAVWPETAIDAVLERDARLLAAVRRQVEASGVPVITGAQRLARGGVTNSALLVVPRAGVIESYAKQRLVPFAEAEPAWGAPLRALFASVANATPYQAGREATVFRRLGVPFAAPICFEVTDAGLMRGFSASGAQFFFNLSNDAWFGRSGYAEMHLAHAVVRAIELRTPIARAANTGISALIDARGRVVASLALEERGAIHAELHANAEPSTYARFGDAPALALMAAGLAAAFVRRRP